MSSQPATERKSSSEPARPARGRFFTPVSRHSRRLGATWQASKELLESSSRKLQVPVHDIRLRILSLVVFAALAPALLVGTASYTTARKILTEKLSEQLSNRALATEQKVNQFLTDRTSDTKVFASAYVVSQNLGLYDEASRIEDIAGKATSRERLRQYLTQVQQRYPLYETLNIFDLEGNLVATTRYTTAEDRAKIDSAFLEARSNAPLEWIDDSVRAYIHHPIVDPNYEPLGTLVTVSRLDELWRSVVVESQNQAGDLIVLDRHGHLLLHSVPTVEAVGKTIDSEGVELALSGQAGISEYSNMDGIEVLGAYRYQPSNQLAYLVEVARDQAFAASLWVRNFSLLVSFVAAGVVTAVAVLILLSLTRPIDKLIAGAKAAAGGDLSQQIPVSSNDQIGLSDAGLQSDDGEPARITRKAREDEPNRRVDRGYRIDASSTACSRPSWGERRGPTTHSRS